MRILDKIYYDYPDEEFVIADGFNDAIIGVETSSMRLIYSIAKCINILMKDMTEEEAFEYFEYNVAGAYIGEKTPIWCEDYSNILEEMNIKEIEEFLRRKKLENIKQIKL